MKIANYLFFNEPRAVLCLHLFASANIGALKHVDSRQQGNDNAGNELHFRKSKSPTAMTR
jgi:hypothetical protein